MDKHTKVKIYFSASIRNAANNEYISNFLLPEKFIVYLPQKITPSGTPDENFPDKVFKRCIKMMNSSDAGLVILDSFGIDSCWECGWYTHSDKILIGFVEASSNFLRDWMLKGGLNGLITTNERLYNIALNDPILKNKDLKLIKSLDEIGDSILTIYNNHLQNVKKNV